MKQTSTPNSSNHITERLKALSRSYAHIGHRQAILVSGDLLWGWDLVYDYLQNAPSTLLVTRKTSPLQSLIEKQSVSIQTVRPDKPSTMLGFDCSNAIIDCTEGFYPDALTSISGTIQPGGFLFIICPLIKDWPLIEDEFAKKRTSYGQTGIANSPNTIKRFLDQCQQAQALLFQQISSDKKTSKESLEISKHLYTPEDKAEQPPSKLKSTDNTAPWGLPNTANAQQVQILNEIKQQTLSSMSSEPLSTLSGQKNTAKHFHIIQADRGRGKSHLLGLLADSLIESNIDNGIKYYITAPNKAAIRSVFAGQQSTNTALEFISPERVLEAVKPNDILLVDEAASLPLPILMAWSLQYNSIIFSTTTHGYEGTGKGFQIRFVNHLKQLNSNVYEHRLSQPIRYAENDPLENIMFSGFCLDSEPKGLVLNSHAINNAQINCREITNHELALSQNLLEDLFALLVQAHYQTRPSDLRDILDSPSIRIFALFITHDKIDYLASACLTTNEGNFGDNENTLIKNIINGSRRPKGHLTPQVLTLHMGQKAALKLNCARIVRIATLPNLQNLNHGSSLLNFAHSALLKDNYDYIASSYADTPDVNGFWNKNGFSIVRTGNKLDKSSGTTSKLVLKALSDKGLKLVNDCKIFCKNQTNEYQTYSDLSDSDKKLVSIFINETGSYEAVKDILERSHNWPTHFKKAFPKKASAEFRTLVSNWTAI